MSQNLSYAAVVFGALRVKALSDGNPFPNFNNSVSSTRRIRSCTVEHINILHLYPIFHHMCCKVSGFMVDLEAEW